MTALPYYHVAARAVPAITATPCGGYPPQKKDSVEVSPRVTATLMQASVMPSCCLDVIELGLV